MARLRLIVFFGALVPWAQAQEYRPGVQSLHWQIMGVFDRGQANAFSVAAEEYLKLLRAIPHVSDPEEVQIARQHLRYIGMVMDPEDPAHATLKLLEAGTGGHIETLISWWHRQDPLPYSENNERLQEHLARLAFALREYGHDKDERGFDDRGQIYLRLGAPSRSQEIKILSAGTWLNPYSARLPDNEFWIYRQIDKEAHYLFVRSSRSQPYKVAGAQDLIPRDLMASRRRVGLLIPVLEEIFAQLALAHPHYGTTYDALNSFMNIPGYSQSGAYQFVRRVTDKMRLDEDFYDRNRQHIIPVAFSNTLGGAATLEPFLRWARFLEPDGRTRIELYWELSRDALAPSRRLLRRLEREGHKPTARYLITFSAALRDSSFRIGSADTRHYSVSTALSRPVQTQVWSTVSQHPLTHLALQWEQRWASPQEDGTIAAGATLKLATRNLDSLQVLSADPTHLEMSDIRPLLLDLEAPQDSGAPFADTKLTPDTPLALLFEVYHLAYGLSDSTHYTVEYQVAFTGMQNRPPLSVASSYQSGSRMTTEQIRLDLSTWQEGGEVRIAVRVTDEVTGQQAEAADRFCFRSTIGQQTVA